MGEQRFMATARDRYTVTPSLADIKAATLANHVILRQQLPDLQKGHAGKFALMRDGAVVDFFDTGEQARSHGSKSYADRLYSVHRIAAPGEEPVVIRSPTSH
jgi:hypothetical protein